MVRLALLLVPVALAQPPDPKGLIADSAAAIKKYASYHLESIVTVDTRGAQLDTHLEMPSAISVRRPDRMNLRSKSQAGTVEIVSDGEHTWYYLSAVKKYVKRDAVASPESAIGPSGLLPKSLPDLEKSIKAIKIRGEETIDIGGAKFPCWVVETSYEQILLPEQHLAIRGAVQTNWISKAEKLSLQNTFSGEVDMAGLSEPVTMAQSTRTTVLRLNAKLADSEFVFTPPANAKATDDWTLPGIVKPDLEGKPSSKAVPGKIVLLQFTAPWCVPCRRDESALEKLRGEFPELKVIEINVDQAEELLAELSVNSFPTTVLIDRDGKIASYEAGVRGEAALRSDLAKLGLGGGSK
jgi:thiol-disulfide isomerase/thioredoxin